MKRSRVVLGGCLLVVSIAVLGLGQVALDAAQEKLVEAPFFEVDPYWPKPLPNHWILGSAIGVGVDSKDHVFIVHRGQASLNARTESGANANPPTGECCLPA